MMFLYEAQARLVQEHHQHNWDPIFNQLGPEKPKSSSKPSGADCGQPLVRGTHRAKRPMQVESWNTSCCRGRLRSNPLNEAHWRPKGLLSQGNINPIPGGKSGKDLGSRRLTLHDTRAGEHALSMLVPATTRTDPATRALPTHKFVAVLQLMQARVGKQPGVNGSSRVTTVTISSLRRAGAHNTVEPYWHHPRRWGC